MSKYHTEEAVKLAITDGTLPDLSEFGCKWIVKGIGKGKAEGERVEFGFIPLVEIVDSAKFSTALSNGATLLLYYANNQSVSQAQRAAMQDAASNGESIKQLGHIAWSRVQGQKVAPITILLPDGVTWQGSTEADYQRAVYESFKRQGQLDDATAKVVAATYKFPF
jgi:hypothetical protein